VQLILRVSDEKRTAAINFLNSILEIKIIINKNIWIEITNNVIIPYCSILCEEIPSE